MTPGKLFAVLSFVFVSVLLIVVFHEVLTGNLPSDNKEKLENISQKYGPDFIVIQEAKGNVIGEDEEFIDEEIRYQDYNFVYCFDEDSQRNITYPEGTECFDDAEEQDDYNYDRDGKTRTEEKEKDRDDDNDKENKYSIQVCPPKCGNDNDNENDNENDKENDEDKDDDKDEEEDEN